MTGPFAYPGARIDSRAVQIFARCAGVERLGEGVVPPHLEGHFIIGAQLCESVIEQMMLAALLWADFGPLGVPHVVRNKSVPLPLGRRLEICPQFPVGKYRADFAVLAVLDGFRDGLQLAVECDGHEFHERTKEQAAADKKRDRHFQELGWKVLRFTGTEIFHETHGCAAQVARIACADINTFEQIAVPVGRVMDGLSIGEE